MPTPTKGPRLGAGPAHQRLMLAGLATALFEHGRITTTEAKARRLRPLAERLITKAKRGDRHARRQVLTVIRDKGIVHQLFTEIGPRYETRPGGYTRITKLGPRKGDAAPMAVIELVEPLAEQVVAEATGATRRAAGDRQPPGRAAPAAPQAARPESAEQEAPEQEISEQAVSEQEAFDQAQAAQEAAAAGDADAALDAADAAEDAAEAADTQAAAVAAETAADAAVEAIDSTEEPKA